MFAPYGFNPDEMFRLRGPVGAVASNHADDVAKGEIALDRLGYLAIDRRQGPSGAHHAELDHGLREYQKARGLKADGVVNPDGPTIRKLAEEAAEAPGPDQVDDTAPTGKPSGIKGLKPDPGVVRDPLEGIKDYLEGVDEGMKRYRPGNLSGRSGRPQGRFNPETGRYDDFFQ